MRESVSSELLGEKDHGNAKEFTKSAAIATPAVEAF